MTCTAISKIKFKKDDGVYFSYYIAENNPTHLLPQSEKKKDCKSIYHSELFLSDGRSSVDRNLVTQIINGAIVLVGKDASLKKYREIMQSDEYAKLITLYQRSTNKDNFFDTEDAQNLLNIIVGKINKRLR